MIQDMAEYTNATVQTYTETTTSIFLYHTFLHGENICNWKVETREREKKKQIFSDIGLQYNI